MPARVRTLFLTLLAAASVLAGAPAFPQERGGYGATGVIGKGGAGGDYGSFLGDTWSAEFDVFLEKGAFRGGIGAEFHRFQTSNGAAFEEFSAVPFYLHAAWTPWPGNRARPYLQARFGLANVHAQPTLDRAAKAVGGLGFGLVPGLELDLTRSLALDVSFAIGVLSTDSFAFRPGDGGTVESGTAWTGRLGLTWRPGAAVRSHEPGHEAPLGPWGVRKRPGMAAANLLTTLTIASVFNEYFHDSNYVQVSPRTWWRNLQRGFEYDDNKFDTNNFYHPWNGALFYSSGRSAGFGFWPSAAITLAGSLLWECCGETLPMSTNDLASTALGGVAMGELAHRVGSVLLDNRDAGASRLLRELGVWVVDPVRGANRVFFKEQRQAANPEDPWEWRPPRLGALVSVGARRVGTDGSLGGDGDETSPVLDFWLDYGSVFDSARRRPFDSFRLEAQFNFTDHVDPAGLMAIRGDLVSKSLGESRNSSLALVQYFDYVNNPGWEMGGQSLGLGLSHRFGATGPLRLELHADALGTVLGAVNAVLEPAGETPLPGGGRRADYGPGLGARAEALLVAGHLPVLRLFYRYQWLHVTNGTDVNGGGGEHDLQIAGVRVQAPLGRRLGLGADATLFLRHSRYASPLLKSQELRQPQVRLYATWQAGGF